jgi:hypothetical protein
MENAQSLAFQRFLIVIFCGRGVATNGSHETRRQKNKRQTTIAESGN